MTNMTNITGTGTTWIPTTTGPYTGTYTVPIPYNGGAGGVDGGRETSIPPLKKPRKPRAKKEIPAHEKEMKEAEAKWKKILDGKK